MTVEARNPCEGMSKCEVQAFERIAFGAPPRCSAGTIANLLNAALIERHEVILAVDRLGPVFNTSTRCRSRSIFNGASINPGRKREAAG